MRILNPNHPRGFVENIPYQHPVIIIDLCKILGNETPRISDSLGIIHVLMLVDITQ